MKIARRWLLLVLMGAVSLGGLMETSAWAQTSSAMAAERKSAFASGTIEAIDAKLMTIKLKTDTGKGLVLKVAKPDLLQELTVGDRVTVELDGDGKAKKIMKSALPELPPPPSAKP